MSTEPRWLVVEYGVSDRPQLCARWCRIKCSQRESTTMFVMMNTLATCERSGCRWLSVLVNKLTSLAVLQQQNVKAFIVSGSIARAFE